MSIDTSIPNFTGTVTRLTATPLIAADMFAPATLAGLEPDALANINGPSVLRMPDWAAGKQAAFHMYFGHHKGKSLRRLCRTAGGTVGDVSGPGHPIGGQPI